MFLPVFFPEKQSTTYRIKFFNVSKKIVSSLSLQKPRACKTKSFLQAAPKVTRYCTYENIEITLHSFINSFCYADDSIKRY